MKIKIDEKNKQKIEEILKQVQGKASARILKTYEIFKLAAQAEKDLDELKISPSNRIGSEFVYTEGTGCSTKKYSVDATYIRLKRGTKDWFFIEVERTYAHEIGKNRVLLGTNAKAQKIKEIEKISL